MKPIEECQTLKKTHNAVILAHFYQPLEVQKAADYIGDSLGLAKKARDLHDADYILFAGVKFMAETASILNQEKTVLCPEPRAGCPLSSFLNPKIISEAKSAHPGSPLVVYVNTTAETKAHADVCCTSSNAVTIVEKAAQKWKTDTILFGPDKNLASYVRSQTDVNIITVPPEGHCPIHNFYSVKDVNHTRAQYPTAKLLVHPESPPEVQKLADFIGSTSQMVAYTRSNPSDGGYIIGTETGLVDHLNWKYPKNSYYPLNPAAICKNMKKSSIEKVLHALKSIGEPENGMYEVRVPPKQAKEAKIPLDRMIEFS